MGSLLASWSLVRYGLWIPIPAQLPAWTLQQSLCYGPQRPASVPLATVECQALGFVYAPEATSDRGLCPLISDRPAGKMSPYL